MKNKDFQLLNDKSELEGGEELIETARVCFCALES